MSFTSRPYDVYLILGNPMVAPGWVESTWNEISAGLDQVVQIARGPAAVRSTQLRPGTGSPNQRAIRFGRLGWNTRDNKKWIHSRSNDSRDENTVFVAAEVWAPSWTICEREHQPPDLYFVMRNERSISGENVAFDPAYLLAVARDRNDHIQVRGRGTAEHLAQVSSALLRARCERPWGRGMRGEFRNAIGDLMTAGGIFRPGPRHRSAVSVSLLLPEWKPF